MNFGLEEFVVELWCDLLTSMTYNLSKVATYIYMGLKLCMLFTEVAFE